ncbi:MAG: 16S rRNA (cytosine(1402)-N(4))-methyltransferase RsmH [Phycisphaerae bacterium]|nr:16S rRNA (cytosine(1402)-N(4))-methyltransferase RsmH [Phycisphaerae bacterium]
MAEHTPVLPEEVVRLLAPQPGEVVVDATVGAGGHACLLADAIGAGGVLYGLDVDSEALEIAAGRLAQCACRVSLHRCNFAGLGLILRESGVLGVDIILADLGVSSMQLANRQRGFSFSSEGLLDMRMDDRLETRACDLVNSLSEQQLADVIYKHSQERFSRRISKWICSARREGRITTTAQLVEVVCKALRVNPRSRRSKIHPATRTFQALRIAVNDELAALGKLLEQAPQYLNPGGRLGIISFHSLEDGMVKHDFRRRKDEELYEVLTKRPVIADQGERVANPRSRSAKLRVARRIARL